MQQGNFLKIPETGDRGSIFCPAISENFAVLDGHTHDGLNSPLVKSSSLEKQSVVIPAVNLVEQSDGDYLYSLTLPTGYGFDNSLFKFIINSGDLVGQEINPTIVKTGDNSLDFKIYTNTFDVKVVIF
jgi:hypothetical protein